MSSKDNEIRCPSCNRLLARVLPSGALEVRRRGKPVAIMESGELHCAGAKCGAVLAVGRKAVKKELRVTKAEDGG